MFPSSAGQFASPVAPPDEEWAEFVAASGLEECIGLMRERARRAVRAPAEGGEATYWSGRAAAPELFGELHESRPIDPGDALGRIGAWNRSISAAQGRQLREIAEFIEAEVMASPLAADHAAGSAITELSLVLGVAPRTAQVKAELASDLAEHLPNTLDALCLGEISLGVAMAVRTETCHLDPEQAAHVDRKLWPAQFGRTPSVVRRAVRRQVAKLDPDLLAKRHEAACKRRGVWVRPEPDGMATLEAYLTATEAATAFGIIDAHARLLTAPGPDGDPGKDTAEDTGPDGTPADATPASGTDPDTQSQADWPTDFPADAPNPGARRADALLDLLTNPAGPKPQVQVQVRLVVPAGTLLGLGDEPGELAGYGPIPADLARHLATDATWRRILTDPASGEVLDLGTTRYRPSAPLVERIRATHPSCTFPTCGVPAQRCDNDHRDPHRTDGTGGATSEENLRPRCRRHHRVKHLPGWSVTLNPDATETWHTPNGLSYRTRKEKGPLQRC